MRRAAASTRRGAPAAKPCAAVWITVWTASAYILAVAPARAGFCAEPTQSGYADAASKGEAETAAISWWASRAGALGRGYEIWDNAADRKVNCREHTNGRFTCQASARPCLPDGVTPENDPRIQL